MICMMNYNIERLSYSEDALSSRVLFLTDFNDINIFVEDTGKEYIYEEIFERLFADEKVSIFSIFPLGGKDAVIKQFKLRGVHDSSGKINVYILDGDFDNLWVDQKIISPNLIYLTRYNIEAYFYSRSVVIKFMRLYMKTARKNVETIINFDELENQVCTKIGELFLLFATVRRYYPDLESVQRGIGRFIDCNGCLLDTEYDKYFSDVRNVLPNINNLIECTSEKLRHLLATGGNNYSITCGKYQIESLCRRLKFYCRKNIHREQFKAHLISHFDLSPLEFLKSQVLDLFYSRSADV